LTSPLLTSPSMRMSFQASGFAEHGEAGSGIWPLLRMKNFPTGADRRRLVVEQVLGRLGHEGPLAVSTRRPSRQGRADRRSCRDAAMSLVRVPEASTLVTARSRRSAASMRPKE
jgi:hypothetical protein